MLQLIQKCFFDLAKFLSFVDKLLDVLMLFVIIEIFIDDLIAISFSIILYFCYACFSLKLDRNQLILHLYQTGFLLDDSTLQFAQKISYCFVLGFIDKTDRLEVMRLMLTEHFALTACRFMTILAEVIQTYPVIFAFLCLLCALKDEVDYVGKLIDETSAMGQLSFDGLSAVWTLGFHFETCRDAQFAVDLGAMRAQSRLVGLAIANLTVDQFLILLLSLIQFALILLGRWLKHHYNYSSNTQANRTDKENHLVNACWSSIFIPQLI